MPKSSKPMNGLFDAETFTLYSEIVNDDFKIFIGKPANLEPGKRYPAIFCLDGNASFASLLSTQRMLAQGAQVPPAFVIGVGYEGNSLMEAMAKRNRDYVPTEPGEAELRALGGEVNPGAPDFLSFLMQELVPTLSEHYAIDRQQLTLQGVSLGGLFGAWTLLTQPESFQNYVLVSPAIWWRGQQLWQWEEALAQTRDDLNARVFVSAGALERESELRREAQAIAEKTPFMKEQIEGMIAFNDANAWPEIAHLVPELVRRLQGRNYPSLSIAGMNFPDENHMSTPPAASSRGLRYVFGSWQP